MVYDFNEKRVGKALKISRKYLHWVQNSVFEGDITDAKLFKLKTELKNLMKENEDSIIFYHLRTKSYYNMEILGLKKGGEELII